MLPFEELQAAATKAIARANYARAEELLTRALAMAHSDESKASILYDRACASCLSGEKEAAEKNLLRCAALGYCASFWARTDPMLTAVKDTSSFQQALLHMRQNLNRKLERARAVTEPLRYQDLSGVDFSAEASPPFLWTEFDCNYYKRLLAESKAPRLLERTTIDFLGVIAAWSNNLWEHDGYNEPLSCDPLSIIQEARQGVRFRCVEYATVFGGIMEASGYRTRVLWLFTANVAMQDSGASHVVAEVFVPEWHRWIFVDVQWGYIPIGTDNLPLSTAAFRRHLLHHEGAMLYNVKSPTSEEDFEDEERKQFYQLWILPYLYMHGALLDQRYKKSVRGREMLLLLPEGKDAPLKFQKNKLPFIWKPTSSLEFFYSPPD
ncbi:hypothetical protein S7335_699 [Synechococcus sp. PCC 7335]|uniref:transglutaminase-like domain-containing protein n=1 Tax=Synechococcus sp. (strain ATCC 29403 / PCC 7335) TaxID=91464 RepID=UPI00017EC457|nr:transglutaminase-like domain-containing protein [Synechococcus sp. PCC 7335]EDX83519.1 hypothetical protein S7335_699 [Synechococcus sp. PCC 7335]